MGAARRKTTRRGRQGSPAWLWLLSGVLIGLGLAYYLWSKGFIPQPQPEPAQAEESATPAIDAGGDEVAPAARQPGKSPYDFFTVLPEMEVVVPEQELSGRTRPEEAPTTPADDTGNYILQVGSFRESSDAEQLRARLALLGITARTQSVTVNDATWHRVRVGPVSGVRQADEMRKQLADNGIESLVMKNQ